MNTIDINKFIDFTALFIELYNQEKSDLERYQYEADHFKRLLEFYEHGGPNSFEIQTDECELTDTEINFVFGMDLEQPNESTNYVATANYFITYNRILKEFTACDYEQG